MIETLRPLCLCVAVIVAGCSSVGAHSANDYEPGSVPMPKFTKDSAVCERQAEADQKNIGLGPLDVTQNTFNRMYDACMRASGYAPKPQQ
jgi:hypothetical protein